MLVQFKKACEIGSNPDNMPPPWYVKVGPCFLKPYESSLPAFFFLWFHSLILNLRSDFFRGPISCVLFFLWSGFLYLGSGFSRGWISRIRFFLGLASGSRSNEERKPNFADLSELSKNGCNYLFKLPWEHNAHWRYIRCSTEGKYMFWITMQLSMK